MPYSADEPNMSDSTLLVSVEDLINMGLGPPHANVVNFKTVQTVLHILARQQRMLHQRVEIRITEKKQESPPAQRKSRKPRETEVSESSSSKSPRSPPPRKRMVEIKEEWGDKAKAEKDKLKAEKERAKAEKEAQKEKERELKAQEKAEKDKLKAEKENAKAEKEAQKEKERELKAQEKAEKSAIKEQEKAERARQKELERALKEKDKTERASSKEREKAERAESREREKAERAASKEREKAERAESREREKAQRAESKEREKAERAAEKEREKAERAAEKEREKADKAAEKEKSKADKEREKAERAAEKEREKAEEADRKEKERAEKEAAKAKKEKSPRGKRKARIESTSSISISEVERDGGNVLIVEKGPTTRSEPRTRGTSIDVVTQSQFALLEAAVKGLMQKAAPMGELKLPDNKQLMGDLARGSASLTDTMQAMQVNARVKAAEEAIDRMAGLLTQLAAAGAVPEDLATQVEEAKREAEKALTSDEDAMPIRPRPSTARKSVAIDPMAKTSQLGRPSTARPSTVSTRGSISTVMGRASVMSQSSSPATNVPEPGVTRGEMEDLIKAVKDDLWKNLNSMTNKATTAAENALHTAKAVAERLDVALKLDSRISTLYSLVSDYAEQLSGFDAGLTTQMLSFREQIAQIQSDLKEGLKLLDSVNNNAETAAVRELTERYEELTSDLERTTHAHSALTAFQGQLGDELRSLVDCIEMLREEKADHDEVIDGLRDKADTSRLAGLLTEAEFANARAELERRLEVCHNKFHRQDGVWMGAIKDLLNTTDLKAEFIDLLSMKDDTQRQLQELHDKLKLLAAVLGEPQAALLTRQLAVDATCGACGAAALMGMVDLTTGKPPALPSLRPPLSPPSPPSSAPCLADWRPPEPEDARHICQRWVGGSHTLVSEYTTREQAPPMQLQQVPTRKFADYGLDGRLYMMEEELQPCVECNEFLQKTAERPPPVGEDGDQGARKVTVLQVIKD